MTITAEDNERLDEARALAARFRAGEVPDIEEVWGIIEKWRTPEDVTREVQFDIVHGWLCDLYGEYWQDDRTPWIPIFPWEKD